MSRFRIKDFHNITKTPENSYLIAGRQFGISTVIEGFDGDNIWPIFQAMGDYTTLDTIEANPEFTDMSETISVLWDTLKERGHLEYETHKDESPLSEDEESRYSRNLNYFRWVDDSGLSPYEVQKRLLNSSVLILGAGGTGSATACSLAAMGVGKIRIVDFDSVEEANLNRQIAYSESDIGRLKVDALRDRIRSINSACQVATETCRVETEEEIARLTVTEDVIVISADTPDDLPFEVNSYCYKHQIPFVNGAYAGPMCVVGVFDPKSDTPCYACVTKSDEQKQNRGDEITLFSDAPPHAVIAPAAIIAANYGAFEIYKILTGHKSGTVGRIFHSNYIDYDHHYFIEGERQSDCPHCNA